jgi:hypothetical protein
VDNSHLHSFDIGGRQYGMAEEAEELEFIDEKGVKLERVLSESIRELSYEYDFGDSWDHQITVESKARAKPHRPYPLCIGGERACPPEDVGGDYGCEEFLQAIRDPKHEEHDNWLLWVGGFFDPEGFDANAVNHRLRKLRIGSEINTGFPGRLPFKWIRIVSRCWQNRTPYDEATYLTPTKRRGSPPLGSIRISRKTS